MEVLSQVYIVRASKLSGQECNTNIVYKENNSTGVRKKSKMVKLGSQSNQTKKPMKASVHEEYDDLKRFPEQSAICQRGNEVKEELISPSKKNGFVSKRLDKAIESKGPNSVVGDRDKGVIRKPIRKPAPKTFRKRS